MEIDEENNVSTSGAETSVEVANGEAEGANAEPIVPPPVIPPPIAPVPVFAAPPPVRPLAPLPVRPPVVRPPSVPQNGDARGSDSDSDNDDAGQGSDLGYEISEESKLIRERQEKAKQELLMKRRAAALAVPTNDMAVRTRLRRLGEPITLFGEREMERRDRLRRIMGELDARGELEKLMRALEEEEASASGIAEGDEEEFDYPFYTEGSRELYDARVAIAKYSMPRAAARIHRAQRRRDDPDEDMDAEVDWALRQAGPIRAKHQTACLEFGS